MKLDTLRREATPEGVEIALPVAGPLARLFAWLIDVTLILVCAVGSIFVFAPGGEAGIGLWLLLIFVLTWGYHVVFEVLLGGASPGKRALGLVVVHEDGTAVGWRSSLLRNLLRFVDSLPMSPFPTYGFGLLSCLVSPDNQRLGDRLAGTLVLHRVRRAPPPPEAPEAIRPLPPPPGLSLDDARLLLAFLERESTWSPQRRVELADRLSALTGATGDVGLERLRGMAAWLRESGP
ncbi:MAG: RDD family protein [Acidobacteriota bacterium]